MLTFHFIFRFISKVGSIIRNIPITSFYFIIVNNLLKTNKFLIAKTYITYKIKKEREKNIFCNSHRFQVYFLSLPVNENNFGTSKIRNVCIYLVSTKENYP